MKTLPALALPIIVFLVTGCADKTFYNLNTPAASLADQYVETDDLSKLPSKKIAMTSFGIEFDTNVVYIKQKSGLKYAGTNRSKTEVTKLSNETMQSIVDDAYGKLVTDLKAAGYDLIPYETYKQSPAYQSLIKIVGEEKSPVSITFRYEGSEAISNSDALVFAPTGMVWYGPQTGELSSRASTLTEGVTQIVGVLGRGFSGEKPLPKAEVDLADALNATVLKVYYVVSPVRSYVESSFGSGTGPADGYTIVGSGETRLSFRTPGASTQHFNFGKKHPPKDGNAFVRLEKDVQMDTALNTYQDIKNHLDAVREMFITKLKAGK